ncbi:Nucleotidyltransferase, DNA polymerase for DNA repair [Fructilactobacillus florum 8D]|uniref:Nucleotidyltransferase, DNA polymerase for DNA repair n=1 Tax=Fructilactobacillus florum 8D TaxID=1221538 RepID=W9EFR0_9LACO|nr:Y-family DNA polymerase [Fructilactobacillus florum]EKK21180.1 Nucleotidyltransferase, DNA polymerase for DNA repair [Fructilactobacillus florum 2F]ETO40111.1 Nucleotidyltransferase, DNA polymerase for DNA repair [Fructilactobacillus florum 8D]
MFFDDEPRGAFFLIDNKSFYASCEAIQRGFNPMKVPLVVISEAENTNGGLVLATSPEAKRLYHLKANVSRQRDLPNDPRLYVVPPRMNLYIKKNIEINNLFGEFTPEACIFPYSIDESILDMTDSWHLFGNSIKEVARLMQKTIRQRLGLYTTVGIGDNPVQAKLALDNYAKHNDDLIGEIHYEDVPQKIWSIKDLTKVWEIGPRTAKHLNRIDIHNMYDLAHANPYFIKQELGVIGSQLFATAWGVDRSKITDKIVVKSKSLGNSQVLPRDYHEQGEIENVIKELGEQVAARVRNHHKLTSRIALGVGFSFHDRKIYNSSGFYQEMSIDATDNNQEIVKPLLYLFRKHWNGQAIRNISFYCSKLSPNNSKSLNLFTDLEVEKKMTKLTSTIDEIHKKYGFSKLVFANSLAKGGTALERAKLVGGHNGGNSYE